MKRYSVATAALALGFLTCFLCGISLAQEQEEELEYSWGTMSSASSDKIIVTEYDYDTDEEVAVAYTVDPNVKLYNVDSLKDIAIGSEVWIDYMIREGEKVAMGIEVKKPTYEEEYMPSQTYEEESEEF